MITVDARCSDKSCSQDIYRMVGYCINCGLKDILILHSVGHESYRSEKCPKCGNRSVRSARLATDDEIPEAR